MICQVCNKEISSIRELSKHVQKYHSTSFKEYYDTYIKQENEGKCLHCGKDTSFVKGSYRPFCSTKCVNNDPNIQQKIKQTILHNHGVENPSQSTIIKKKKEESYLKKYGTKHITQSKHFKDKSKETWNIKYGVDNPSQSDIIKEKKKKTKLEKYNNENYNNIVKFKQTCEEKYNVENVFQLDEIKEKSKQTCLEKYGVDNYTKTKEYKEKSYQTKKKNNSFHISQPEDDSYLKLLEKYPDVIRQYKDELYPFACDFYIPSLKLYIEYNGSWVHGEQPFDEHNKDHQDKLKLWIEKSKTSDFYKQAIYVWTDLDVRKREMAKINNLNYKEFYTIEELQSFITL